MAIALLEAKKDTLPPGHGLDLKAVNPNRKEDVDRRTPAELLHLIEAKGREVTEALAALRALT